MTERHRMTEPSNYFISTLLFKKGMVTLKNSELLNRIKNTNPHYVDWSNIPDYVSKKEFFDIAKKISNEQTVHYMHSMVWHQQIPGTHIVDYPEEQYGGDFF